jgi:hypothetical protein
MAMTNTFDTATHWVRFIARQPTFPADAKLLAAFSAGKITRLCDCGCNAFDFTVPDGTSVSPLVGRGSYGSVCELSFEANEPNSAEQKSIEFIVFADQRGHFAGFEVDFCGNSFPVPEQLVIHEHPYHVRCSSELTA